MSSLYVRIQEKGQVTIPLEIRQKLKLKKGDLVTFIETDKGVVIKPAEVIALDALDDIGRALEAKGYSLEEMIERGRAIREEFILEEQQNLKPRSK
jgi:AbrB family looped-hinge helix DNA binding protein